MSKTMIITDTCSDLPAGLVDCYDVEILSTTFNIDDKFFNEGIDFTCENFYEILPAPKGKIKSVSIPAAIYLDRFKNAHACGFDSVIIIMTGSVAFPMHRTAEEAIELYKTQNPTSDLRIEMVDTKCFSMCAGLVVIEAAKLAQEGTDVDEILTQINHSCSQMTMLVDAFNIPLSFLDSSRPWKKYIQFTGSYHPFPTLKINSEKAIELPIIKGDHSAFDQFYAYCIESLRDTKPDYAIGYASRKKEARAIAMLLEAELGYAPVTLYKLGAISAYGASKAAITLCFKAPGIEEQLRK
ncbi:MAG: DegV family protein [Clostridia bacterium]|nr:DegV family protein [Clostridia bacterium]MBQ2092408.1 DegV family protein [Clostridia bacterium]